MELKQVRKKSEKGLKILGYVEEPSSHIETKINNLTCQV